MLCFVLRIFAMYPILGTYHVPKFFRWMVPFSVSFSLMLRKYPKLGTYYVPKFLRWTVPFSVRLSHAEKVPNVPYSGTILYTQAFFWMIWYKANKFRTFTCYSCLFFYFYHWVRASKRGRLKHVFFFEK